MRRFKNCIQIEHCARVFSLNTCKYSNFKFEFQLLSHRSILFLFVYSDANVFFVDVVLGGDGHIIS